MFRCLYIRFCLDCICHNELVNRIKLCIWFDVGRIPRKKEGREIDERRRASSFKQLLSLYSCSVYTALFSVFEKCFFFKAPPATLLSGNSGQ